VSLIEKVGGQPNGIALSPDEKKLFVVGGSAWNIDDSGAPTTKTSGGAGGDGISVDCAGNVRGVDTNSAFGGPDGKTLFVVGRGGPPRIVQYNVPGLP
jgi:sugar lactone lactonase YvrE